MNYEIRHCDTPLLRFSATEDTARPEIEILWVNDDARQLIPLDLTVSPEGVASWFSHRTIPKNRAYVHNFLSKCGLNLNRPMSIVRVSKALSLNDCCWVVEEGFAGSFDKYNLYDNRFSRILSLIAFTGYGSSVTTSLMSSPEFTTNGMLPKCWRRIDGRIQLFKGGTTGASNSGNEPYSEYYAAQIAETLGIRAIPYGLSNWKGELCSTCELFTSKDYAFLPVGRLVTRGGMAAVREYYQKLGTEYVDALNDILVLDAVICNTDRHYGNFGLLIDNKTNQIAAPAPLFDHGNSLFNFAVGGDLQDADSLAAYADSLVPAVYDDFIGSAKSVMTKRHKDALRKLLNFRFKRHPRYNLPDERLMLIEKEIQRRARLLLDE
ncbi:MAG: XRE family transcriptional regulator [Oscillospiraceae bacterium]|nr:XRE family transcriptional regulator [Oscillospiraceae bacterium]